MAWFGAFRSDHGFTWYGDYRTPVTFDFPLAAVTYLCIVLAVATLVSTLGIRGSERWATTLRASYAVGIGAIILVCIVGHDWLVGKTEVETHYLYRSDNMFRGTLGMRVALHGCNVTLEGYYTGVNGEGHVHYVESMEWTDYGKEQETISHYLHRGLPHPVLTVMDFLSVDGGGLRFGRDLHSAGYFGCALLWTAFAFWLVSNVLLMSVVSYGAFMFCLTGVAMTLSCIVYHVCNPWQLFRIRFGDSELTTHYGWCYWLALCAGIVTMVLGAALFLCDHLFHEKVSEFFSLENLDEDDVPDLNSSLDSSLKCSDKGSQLPFHMTSHSGHYPRGDRSRNNSLPQQPSQQPRRPSIFLEPERRPERRPSDFAMARGQSTFGVGGITNKGFEQDRGNVKSNPLFSDSSSDIQEVMEEGEHLAEVRVEKERGSITPHSSPQPPNNRQPSLATMREHRQNHINERQQKDSDCYVIGGSDVICTAVVIESPSDEDRDDVTTAGNDAHVGETAVSRRKDYSNDSAIASASPSPSASHGPSPAGSAHNSTYGDMEEIDN